MTQTALEKWKQKYGVKETVQTQTTINRNVGQNENSATTRKNDVLEKWKAKYSTNITEVKKPETHDTSFDARVALEKNIGFDTINDDLSTMNTTIKGIYNNWQNKDTMLTTKTSVENMYNRLNAYEEYRNKYGNDEYVDISDLVNTYKSVLNEWDTLAEVYGNYESVDEYNNAVVAYTNTEQSGLPVIKPVSLTGGFNNPWIKKTSPIELSPIYISENKTTENTRNSRIDEINSELKKISKDMGLYAPATTYRSTPQYDKLLSKREELLNELKTLQNDSTPKATLSFDYDTKISEIDTRLDSANARYRELTDIINAHTGEKELDSVYSSSVSEQEYLYEEIKALKNLKKAYEKAKKYGGVVNEDDFIGQFKSNYRTTDISRDMSKSANELVSNKINLSEDPYEDYDTTGNPEMQRAIEIQNNLRRESNEQQGIINKEATDVFNELSKTYQINNAEALDEEGRVLPWISKSAAGYLPQFFDQAKAQVEGGAAGFIAGAAIGQPKKGAQIGASIASGVQEYEVMRGMVYMNLIEAGVDEETAIAAANDEALISGIIEAGSTAVGWMFSGTGKALDAIGNAAIKSVAKGSANPVMKNLAKLATNKAANAVAKPLWQKALDVGIGIAGNVASEEFEEFSQQGVSIANEERAVRGETGKLNLLKETGKTIWDAVSGKNPEALAQMNEARKEGGKIGFLFGGSQTIVNNVVTHYANAKTIKEQNEIADTIINDKESLDALIEEGKASGKGTVSEKIATEVEKARENGTVTREQVKRLIASNEVYIEAEEKQQSETEMTEPDTLEKGENISDSSIVLEKDEDAYPYNMQEVIEGYEESVDENTIDYVNSVRNMKDIDAKNRRRFVIGKVSDRFKNDVKRVTGIDFDGDKHVLRGSAVVHIDNRHGINGEQDHSMSHDDDIGRIGWVIENYDSMEIVLDKNGEPDFDTEFRNADGSSSPKIKISKKINGTYYVVEAVPDSSAKTAYIKSAYISNKDSGRTSDGMLNMAHDTPQPTSKTPNRYGKTTPIGSPSHWNPSTTNDSISQNGDIVNGDFVGDFGENPVKVAETKATEAAYEAGRANVPRESVTLETPEQEIAYNEGRIEYIKNMNSDNSTQNNIDKAHKNEYNGNEISQNNNFIGETPAERAERIDTYIESTVGPNTFAINEQHASGRNIATMKSFFHTIHYQKKPNGSITVYVEGERTNGMFAPNEEVGTYGTVEEAYTAAIRYLIDEKGIYETYPKTFHQYNDLYNERHPSVDIVENDEYISPEYETFETRKPIVATDFRADNQRRAEAAEKYGLSDDEATRLGRYVGGPLCYILNERMIAGTLKDGEISLVESIRNALLKMPEYSGRTYRNLKFNTEKQYNDFLSEHSEGNMVELKAFTSTSKLPNGYPVFRNGVVHLVIDGVSGRDIADTFGLPRQQEVVYLPGTVIEIKKVMIANDGNPLIFVQEVKRDELIRAKETRSTVNNRPQTSLHQDMDRQRVDSGGNGGNRYGISGETRSGDGRNVLLSERGKGAEAGNVLGRHGEIKADSYVEPSQSVKNTPTAQLLIDYSSTVDDIMSVSDEDAKKYVDERVAVEVAKNTPNVILDNVEGARDLKIIINYSNLYLAIRRNGVLKGHYHNLGTEIAKKLPEFLKIPDAIIQLGNGRLNLFASVKTEKGSNGIISIELNSNKDIGGKNEDYNVVVTLFSSNDNYVQNLISEDGVAVKYEREDLSQVNPQLYKWLATINDKTSPDNIVSQDNDIVKSIIRSEKENDTTLQKKSKNSDDVDRMQFHNDSKLAMWTTKRVGDEVKPKSISEIVATIEHEFGINITTGHIRGKGVLGTYTKNNRGIKTKIANNLPVISHELGHYFERTLDIKSQLTEDLIKELKTQIDPELAANYTDEQVIREGVAEYVRRFLQNRETAAIDYPKFSDFFLKLLPSKDLAKLQQLADDINAYYSLDADTATSSIRLREEGGIDLRTPVEKLEDTASSLYQAWVDSNHSIKRFDIATGSNAYMYATNAAYSDAIAGQIITGDLTDKNGQYISSGLKTALYGIDLNAKHDEYRLFGEYLTVKHGPERLREGMRIFADDRKNSSAWMKNRQEELEAQYPQFKEASERLYEFIKQFYKAWGVDTGLISQEMLDSWSERWKYYVPFNRVMEKGKGFFGAKRGFANQNSTIKRARGSGRDIRHPVDNIIDNIVKMVNAGTRNNVMAIITDSAEKFGANATFIEKMPMPMTATKMDITGVKEQLSTWLKESDLDADSKETASGIVNSLDDILVQYSKDKPKGNVVTVLKGGKPEAWKINDVGLLESLTSLSPKTMNGIADAYAVLSRFMTANITGNNLIWSIFSNLPRDFATFFTYSKNKNIIKMAKGVGSAYLNKAKGDNADPLYKEFLAMGGGKTSAYTSDRNLAKNARKKLSGKKIDYNPLNWIGFASDMIETGPRFATYKLMRGAGMSPQEAFYEAMDITTNFRRSGRISKELNKVVPFFNANMQGLDKFRRWITVEELAGKPERTKAIAGRTLSYIAVSAVLAAITYAINNGDEEKEKEYEQLSNYTKNTYWVFPIGSGRYFAIPKPRDIGVLSSFFETCLEYGVGENDHAFDEFYAYASENFLPAIANDIAQVGSNGVVETGMNILGSFGMIGVLGYLGANRDFLGRPIVASGLQNLEPKDQYTDRTSKIAYWLGQAFNGSPEQIDYFFGQVLGGWWKGQKALFPIGEKNRDWTFGVYNTYIKDNQYSTDLTNWLYDRADMTARAKKSNPSDIQKAITAKWDSNMTDFYGTYYKKAKNTDTTSTRSTRQLVLDMIREYQKGIDGNYKTSLQKVVEAVCEAKGSTEYLPSVMSPEVTDGNDMKHNLSDVQYVEYQTDYLRLYWETIEDTITTEMSTEKKAQILLSAKRVAREQATERTLKRIGAPSSDFAIKYKGIANDDLTEFLADVSSVGDDNSVKKSEIVNIISGMDIDSDDAWTLYLSKYDSTGSTYAHDNGIDGNTYIDFLDALAEADRPTESGKFGTYTQDEAYEAINGLTGLSRQEKAILWQSVNTQWKEKNNPFR